MMDVWLKADGPWEPLLTTNLCVGDLHTESLLTCFKYNMLPDLPELTKLKLSFYRYIRLYILCLSAVSVSDINNTAF